MPTPSSSGVPPEHALVGAAIYVGVRLSLAGPATCAEGRLVVFESWTMTHGHFWRLLGAYVLAIFLAVSAEIAVLAAPDEVLRAA